MLYKQINSIPEQYLINKIAEFKSEDAPNGDITSLFTILPNSKSKAALVAREDMVLSGNITLKYFFDDNCEIKLLKNDGDILNKGEIIAEIYGSSLEILKNERLFLNLIQRMSGIATMAHTYSKLAKPYNVRILDTRKTTPGLRYFEKYSVCMGGGTNHRFDLSSGILIKDNHLVAAGGVLPALKKIKIDNINNFPVELEVDNFDQLQEGLNFGIDGVLLDNYTPQETIKAVELIRDHKNGKNVFIESSGGINLNNIKNYLPTGINAISSGALTHSVKSADIGLDFI